MLLILQSAVHFVENMFPQKPFQRSAGDFSLNKF